MFFVCVDVPPLEDLTEAVHRARALRTQLQGPGDGRDESRMRGNGGAAQSKRGVAGAETVLRKSAEPEEAQGITSQSFGGFAKGFLLSTPSGPSPSTRSHNSAGNSNPSQPDCDTHKEGSTFTKSGTESSKSGLALDGDGNIPFLKPKATAKGPVFPEVQEAMKDAYPLLNTQGCNVFNPCSGVVCCSLVRTPSPSVLFCRMVDRVTAGKDGEASSPLQGTAGSTLSSCDVAVPVEPQGCAAVSCRQSRAANLSEGVL